MLNPKDYIGISFWLISIAMFATSLFLVLERKNVDNKWNTSISISIIITAIAAIHYQFMKHIWITTNNTPVTYRYVDWFLTVPLQIIEFYVLLSISNKIPKLLFVKLLVASIFMLIFGYLGEIGVIKKEYGFILGTLFWLYIIYVIFFGEIKKIRDETDDTSVIFAVDCLKWIISIGWLIYPIGYLLKTKNLIFVYNIGDFVNKILFCLIIWYAAKYKN